LSGFLGRYEYQMDDKGRVSLPAAFRRAADDPSFVLVQVQAPALTLFPAAPLIRFAGSRRTRSL
jgi:MraZ protein